MTEKQKIKHYEEVFGRKFEPELTTLDARGTQLNGNSIETLLVSKSIGSRYGVTEYWVEANEIKCGCWFSDLDEFEREVKSVYATGLFRKQYIEFIAKCRKYKSK